MRGSVAPIFLLLDIEGSEINPLRGASTTLSSDQPAIVIKFGMKTAKEVLYGETFAEFVQMMGALVCVIYTTWAVRTEESILIGYPFWYLFALPEGSRGEGPDDWLAAYFAECLQEN